MSTHLKLIIASAAALSVTSMAEACTCPPYADAAQHAEEFDFVAFGHVEDVWQLPVDDGSEAMFEYERVYTIALEAYVEAVEAGEDTRGLDEFSDDFYAENPPPRQPPYPQGGGAISRISISNVFKGDPTSQIYLHTGRPGNPTCGVSYADDSDIIVLANNNGGRFGAWMCSLPRFSREEYEAALSGE
ncbi:hypothetical protein [Ponticaulis koreensis]|uniref:hypothetical protein n=1 Tax=Ponticaulis koreensis TaxID=1123045 RepID=UPI0003B76F19|nr:hypothetical protein [Ponticaulis koreensis]